MDGQREIRLHNSVVKAMELARLAFEICHNSTIHFTQLQFIPGKIRKFSSEPGGDKRDVRRQVCVNGEFEIYGLQIKVSFYASVNLLKYHGGSWQATEDLCQISTQEKTYSALFKNADNGKTEVRIRTNASGTRPDFHRDIWSIGTSLLDRRQEPVVVEEEETVA